MSLLISVLITFVVVILVLYLVNMLPIDGRARQIVRVIVIIIGVLSLLRYISSIDRSRGARRRTSIARPARAAVCRGRTATQCPAIRA